MFGNLAILENPRSPFVVWFTGLSGAGKSTLAKHLGAELASTNIKSVTLDGDVMRKGLCSDLGFSDADRAENIRRTAQVSRILVNSGTTVIAAFISPFRKDRDLARNIIAPYECIETFLSADFAACERRDTKGLYQRARRGAIQKFTGLDSPYEMPVNPALVLATDKIPVAECVERIISYLTAKDLLPGAAHR